MNRLWSTAFLVLVLTLLGGCQQQPEVAASADDSGLATVEHSGLKLAKIDPAVDLASYGGIIIEPLGFSRLDIVEPAGSSMRYGHFTLDDGDKQALRQLYTRQINLALSADGRFRIATAPGAGTLKLISDLVKLEPNAPREKDLRYGTSVRDEIYTEGAGRLTLEAQLVDSVSGKTVMLLRDRLTDSEIWSSNNPVSNRAAVTRAFSRWAAKLRRQFDALSGRTAAPPGCC